MALRVLAVLSAITLLIGCSDSSPPSPTPDGGSASCKAPRKACGDDCCDSSESCFEGACCTPSCGDRVCGKGTCGATCGECDDDETCNSTGQCVANCIPKTAQELCSEGRHCGSVTFTNCGVEETHACGDCTDLQYCAAADKTCKTCVEEDEAAFCARMNDEKGTECGITTGLDLCERSKSVDCGQCPQGKACGADNRCVECGSVAPSVLCTAAGATCGKITALDKCQIGHVVQCGECAGSLLCGVDNTCAERPAPAALPTWSCDQARPLVFTPAGISEFEVDPSLAADTGNPVCSATASGDVKYALSLASEQRVEINVRSTGSIVPAVVSVQKSCAADTAVYLCAADEGEGAVLDRLEAGSYFLSIDASGSQVGLWTVTVKLLPVEPVPENDTCAYATALEFVEGHATAKGASTQGALDDGSGHESCLSSTDATYYPPNGGDVFYSFSVPEGERWSFWAKVKVLNTPLPRGVALRTVLLKGTDGCSTLTDLGCNSPGEPLSFANLASGDYYLAVRATNGGGIRFDLDAYTGKGANNTQCGPNVQTLTFDGDASIPVFGDTSYGGDSESSVCVATQGRELFFSFEIPVGEIKKPTVTVRPIAPSRLAPVVSLRTSCEERATELCAKQLSAGEALIAPFEPLAAGIYYLVVDGVNQGSDGAFTLGVSLSDPTEAPENDTCADAPTLDLEAMPLEASTRGATRGEASASCAHHTGPNVFYKLPRFSQPTNLTISISSIHQSVGYIPTYSLWAGCDQTAKIATAEKQCSTGTASNNSSKFNGLNPNVDYYLAVGGANGSSGDFRLNVQAFEVANNYLCGAELPLLFTTQGAYEVATATGNTSDVPLSSSAFGSGCASANGAKDLLYSFSIPAGETRAVTLEMTSNAIAPHLTLKRASECNVPRAELACATSAKDTTLSMHLGWLEGGDYSLIADSANQSYPNGAFSLSAKLKASAAPAWNDTCDLGVPGEHPKELSFMGGDTAFEAGSTAEGKNDHSGSCALRSGGELVYQFSLASGKSATIEVTRAEESGLAPVVYVRRDCGVQSTEVACATGSSAAKVKVPGDELGGDYFIFVDSASPVREGAFLLKVTTEDAVQAPNNDRCDTAGNWVINVPTTGSRRARINGESTINARDDYRGKCELPSRLMNGGDRVAMVLLQPPLPMSEASKYRLTATVIRRESTPSYRPAVYLWENACPATTAQEETACGADTNRTGVAVARIDHLAYATYFLVVDGLDATSGDFDLELAVEDAVDLPYNCDTSMANCHHPDHCRSPGLIEIPSALSGETTLSFRGDTLLAGDDARSTRLSGTGGNSGVGPDLVYQFTIHEEVDLSATVRFESLVETGLIYLRRACESEEFSDELGASDRVHDGEVNLRVQKLAGSPTGTTYWLWVDSGLGLRGRFTGTLTLTPASGPNPPYACSANSENTLQFGMDHAVRVSGRTDDRVNYHDGPGGNCPTLIGGEAVYFFEVTAAEGTRRLVADARGSIWSPTYTPALYLRRAEACDSIEEEDQLVCDGGSDGASSLVVNALVPGWYALFVDGIGEGGSFNLTVAKRDPITHCPDSCAEAQRVSFSAAGVQRLEGTLYYAKNHGRDVGLDTVYAIDTTAMTGKADLAVTVQSINRGARTTIHLGKSCFITNADRTIASTIPTAGYSAPVVLGASDLDPGVYYLWIDQSSGTLYGPYTLEIAVLNRLPALDAQTCGGQVPELDLVTYAPRASLDNTAPIRGTTLTGASGKQSVFYRFKPSLAARYGFSVWASPATPNAFLPTVAIRDGCAGSASVIDTALSTPTAAVSTTTGRRVASGLTTQLIAQTEYYIEISGPASASAGEFYLEFYQVTETTNDCSASTAAIALAKESSQSIFGVTQKTGTVYKDLITPSCAAATTDKGHEAIFKLTVPGEATDKNTLGLLLRPTYGSLIHPAIAVMTSCETGKAAGVGEVFGACDGNLANTSTIEATRGLKLHDRPGGETLYVVVEGKASNAGPFELIVTTTASLPEATPGDKCGTPISLDTLPAKRVGEDVTWARDTIDTGIECIGFNAASNSIRYKRPGGDRFYSFSTTSTTDFEATVTPSAQLAPVISLRSASDCTDLGPEGAFPVCNANFLHNSAAGLPVTLSYTALPAGEYVLIVDFARQETVGTFDLEVSAWTSLLPSDSCPANTDAMAALPLDPTGRANVQGDASYLSSHHEYHGTCYAGAAPATIAKGLDIVYKVGMGPNDHLMAKATLVKNASASAPASRPIMYVRKSCGAENDPSAEIACWSLIPVTSGIDYTIATPSTSESGFFYLFIDTTGAPGNNRTTGYFDVSVLVSHLDMTDTNDTCANPRHIERNVPVFGDTRRAENDYNFSAFNNTTVKKRNTATGRELVYSALSNGSTTRVTVTPLTNFDPLIWVQAGVENCAAPFIGPDANLINAKGSGVGAEFAETILELPSLPEGDTWYIFVDSDEPFSSGEFLIELR